MSKVRISWEEKDSFEAQTDQMSAADAHTELLTRVAIVRQVIGRQFETQLIVNTETTKDGFTWMRDVQCVDNPEIPPDELYAAAFAAWRVLWEIEWMLDPGKKDFWKLHLKQRRRGKRKVPLAIANDIYGAYGEARCFEPETLSKTVIGRLAAEYDVSDNAIREVVRRMHGKKPKNKKLKNKNRGK
jgi:hypothetical protein